MYFCKKLPKMATNCTFLNDLKSNKILFRNQKMQFVNSSLFMSGIQIGIDVFGDEPLITSNGLGKRKGQDCR